MMTKKYLSYLLYVVFAFFFTSIVKAQDVINMPLENEGYIPVWWIDGPYSQPIKGFGDPDDLAVIDEKNPQIIEWALLHVGGNSFLNLNDLIGWKLIPNEPEKIWHVKAGYAFSEISSDTEQEVDLLFGGNTVSKIIFNGEEVYSSLNQVNAKKDEFSISLKLRKGSNTLLLKTINSNKNYSLAWFIPLKYEWGFFARLQPKKGRNLSGVSIQIKKDILKEDIKVISQFFFKKENDELKQRFDLEYFSTCSKKKLYDFTVSIDGEQYKYKNNLVYPGYNHFEIYLPEIVETETSAKILVESSDHNYMKEVVLQPRKKYELHLMPLAHTDIGYTHPQPIVKEIHLNTIDDVISLLDTNKEFTWTIENTWQTEEFRKARPQKDFEKLMNYVKDGRVALSPLYTNPFTGWVSKSEMERSFDKAIHYKDLYDINYSAAVYNDVPGQVWYLQKALQENGVKFLVNGINEVYDDYRIQKSLPKVFRWQGTDNSEVVLYMNEAYNEGMRYGLSRDSKVSEYRIWERLTRLEERGYNYNLVLLDMVLTDNAGIPYNQLINAQKWNEKYEYPKFVFSNASRFADEFVDEYFNQLPVLKGDLTSTWDLQYQGEIARMIKYRKTQFDLPTAEKLAAINLLLDNKQLPMMDVFKKVYDNMLLYSGHGSGMEYGFGSALDNKITDDYRESYVENARLDLFDIISSSMRRMTVPKESFDSFGVIVFNPLSWERSDIVNLEFKQGNNTQYGIKDITEDKILKSAFKNNTLTFVAENVPSVGYKQYEIIPLSEKQNRKKSENSAIENNKFKITINEETGSISNIIDKESDLSILQSTNGIVFGEVYEKYYDENEFRKISKISGVTTILKDEFSETVQVKYHEGFIKGYKIELFTDLDYVDYEITIDLTELPETDKTTEYVIGFPIKVGNEGYSYDILGGFMQASDRLPGSSKNMFAIRRGVESVVENKSVLITSLDCRIFRVEYKEGSQYLAANIVNNFQENWNRNEKNDSVVKFRFRIYTYDKDILKRERLSDESISSFVSRMSWYTKDSVSKSYFTLDNPKVTISSIRPISDGEVSIEIQNLDKESQKVSITSELFRDKKVSIKNKIVIEHDKNIEFIIKGNKKEEILITN